MSCTRHIDSGSTHGFTLLELALVLGVLSLIAGGVIVGRTLVHNAELKSLLSDVDRFRHAASLFRDKYHYPPGDFPNAAQMWGTDTGCNSLVFPNEDHAAPNNVTKKETCGGNGDGFIAGTTRNGLSAPDSINSTDEGGYRESLRAWQHLANAGFLEGAFSGAGAEAPSAGAGTLRPGVNMPLSKAGTKGGYQLFFSSPVDRNNLTADGSPHPGVFPGRYGVIINYGVPQDGLAPHRVLKPALTADDAITIDQSIDDGRPGTGPVMSHTPQSDYAPECTTGSDPAGAEYDISRTGITCVLLFVTGL